MLKIVLLFPTLALGALVDRPAIPEAGFDQELLRGRSLSEVFTAGPETTECFTREIEKLKVSTPKSSEFWYVSDGSCLIRTQSSQDRYEAVKKMLLTPSRYPQKAEGFGQVLEHIRVDKESGNPDPDQDLATQAQAHFYMGLKGLDLGVLRTAFDYFYTGEPKETEEDVKTSFYFPWGTHAESPMPESIRRKRPALYEVREDGSKKFYDDVKTLERIAGSWYVERSVDPKLGDYVYVRYFNAADLEMDFRGPILDLMKKKASKIHGAALERVASEGL